MYTHKLYGLHGILRRHCSAVQQRVFTEDSSVFLIDSVLELSKIRKLSIYTKFVLQTVASCVRLC